MFFNEDEFDIDMKNTIKHIEQQIENKQIPEHYPSYMINTLSFESHKRRDNFIKLIGFILISLDWIKPLSNWIGNRKCLEVMCGTGSLSYALQQQNINIVATDDFSWKYNWKANNRLWINVENINAVEAIKKYNGVDIILMSWPYMDNSAYHVLHTMREYNPKCKIIYIGEGIGGCTADDEFHDKMIEIVDDEFENAVSNFKSWQGIHDYPQLIK